MDANPYRTAIEIIEAQGWTTGRLRGCDIHKKSNQEDDNVSAEGGVCLDGALGIALELLDPEFCSICAMINYITPEAKEKADTFYARLEEWEPLQILVDIIAEQYPMWKGTVREASAQAIIWRFNDNKCDSGENAIQILEKAALKYDERI